MTLIRTLFIATTLAASALTVHAASHAGAPMGSQPVAQKGNATAAVSDMAEGEVRKLDKENKKVTLKHGVIKNLDMPGMTMVFQVKDAALLDSLKAGDKVKFKAEQVGSALMVTEIQPVK